MSTSPTAVTLQQIAQIAINAKDIKRATAFYRDVLGCPEGNVLALMEEKR